MRALAGVTDQEARRRFLPMNCISWNVGHLAWQEQRYFVTFAQGTVILPELDDQFALVDRWTDEVVTGIHTVRAAGEGALAQILDLGFIADVVALELADRAGIDPGPTPTIPMSPAAAVEPAAPAEG